MSKNIATIAREYYEKIVNEYKKENPNVGFSVDYSRFDNLQQKFDNALDKETRIILMQKLRDIENEYIFEWNSYISLKENYEGVSS